MDETYTRPEGDQGRHQPVGMEDTPEILPAVLQDSAFGADWQETATGRTSPTWRPELLRWLATLNPGRTQTEYQKAVSYFFETPGVPQYLEDLTFDLLLAYRGALAVRATAHDRGAGRHTSGSPRSGRPAIAGGVTPRLEPGTHTRGAHAGTPNETGEDTASVHQGPLSPATVNLRLTALRQFLVHCALMDTLPQLTPDRIRGALRRMSVERRRPYQILAEQEWADFLEAARLPATLAPQAAAAGRDAQAGDDEHDDNRKDVPRGPWGTPKAVRASAANAPQPADGATASSETALPRSHAGLTGRYTAQRDYALVSLALSTGLRAIELAELDVGDLVREWHSGVEEWWLVLPDAKTKGQHGGRTLPLAPTLMETLLAYISSTERRWDREEDRATPLFLAGRRQRIRSRSGSLDAAGLRLSPQQIRAVVDRIETQWLALREAKATTASAMAAGETRKISPHALRHSTAIALLAGNDTSGRPPASVEHVRGWLGHFDIRTTQGYLAHLDARRHRRPYTLSVDKADSTTKPDLERDEHQ